MTAVLLLLVCDLAAVVDNVERRSAYKFLTWAKQAEAAELHATEPLLNVRQPDRPVD